MQYHRSESLQQAIADSIAYQQQRGDDFLLESHFVYAVLANPKRLMSMICERLGVTSVLVDQAIAGGKYPEVVYSSILEDHAAEKFLALPHAPLLKETHVFLTLSSGSAFSNFLTAFGFNCNEFVHECFCLTGRGEMVE